MRTNDPHGPRASRKHTRDDPAPAEIPELVRSTPPRLAMLCVLCFVGAFETESGALGIAAYVLLAGAFVSLLVRVVVTAHVSDQW